MVMVKVGKLIVLLCGGGKSVSGKLLLIVMFMLGDLFDYDINFLDCVSFVVVCMKVYDCKMGKKIDLMILNLDVLLGVFVVYMEWYVFVSLEVVKVGVMLCMVMFNWYMLMSWLMMCGCVDLLVEKIIVLKGFKIGVDGEFLIELVEYMFVLCGWIMVVILNGGNKGKVKVGYKKKLGKKINLVVLVFL